jgi:hypothetical protein
MISEMGRVSEETKGVGPGVEQSGAAPGPF